jgi:uncharacterized protein
MQGEPSSPSNEFYNFRQPMLDPWRNISTSLLGLLSATEAFQRLKEIRFLGAIDYVLIDHPNYRKGNVRHSRFHHSRGVARLAIDYAEKNELSKRDRLTLMSAALLHDIGHCPFSHSLEPIFRDKLGIDHHQATADIITGKLPIGREVYGVLRDQFIDVERVIALISGEDTSYHGLFSGPLNFDTVEGVLRSYSYIATGNIPNPHHIIDATVNRNTDKDRQIVDQFWMFKDRIYRSIINSTIGALSDRVCQLVVQQHADKLQISDYFSTDLVILRRIPFLRAIFKSLIRKPPTDILHSNMISFHSRRFYIDSTSDFFLRDDTSRYKQTKSTEFLKLTAENPAKLQSLQDFFDDDLQKQLSLFE